MTTIPTPGLRSPSTGSVRSTSTSSVRSTSTGSVRSQIPHGVQDCFLVEAARRRQAEAVLRERLARWGYQEVIPPTFEYYENLIVGASAGLRQAMYRFFDREEHTLALRVDFTPQVARMAATKLFDQPMPLRCFYVGSVFRCEEPQAGRKREFTQAGVELVGAATPAADAEVVALAVAALEALDLRDFQVNLGQVAFFRALTNGLPADALAPIREAVDYRNSARLADALTLAGVAGSQHDLLHCLPDLIGGPEVLDEARALSAHLPQAFEALAALEHLARVYRLLRAYGVGDRVILDLGEVRGMDYYTGITFRGMTPNLGWPVVSGGRYDDLIARFGRPLAAIGFGLCIERALLAQIQQGAPAPSLAPHVLVRDCDRPACLALVKRLRQRGCRVEIDVLGPGALGLAEQARQRGIPRTLRCADAPRDFPFDFAQGMAQDAAWLLVSEGDERLLTEAALLREAETWIS